MLNVNVFDDFLIYVSVIIRLDFVLEIYTIFKYVTRSLQIILVYSIFKFTYLTNLLTYFMLKKFAKTLLKSHDKKLPCFSKQNLHICYVSRDIT